MTLEDLINARDGLRERWQLVRDERLDLKNFLTGNGYEISETRRNREFRRLKKEQRHISKMIRHIEDKIRRAGKNE